MESGQNAHIPKTEDELSKEYNVSHVIMGIGGDMEKHELVQLQEAFASLPDGAVDENSNIYELLAQAWDSLDVTGTTNLTAEKLYRIENLRKKNGRLYFEIERHGATVHNSIYAHVYSWEVDLNENTAEIIDIHRRQIGQRDKPLDVVPIAKEIVQCIIEKTEHNFIKWNNDKSSCLVLTAKAIPSTVKEITMKRRRRLRREINVLLAPLGLLITNRNRVVKI